MAAADGIVAALADGGRGGWTFVPGAPDLIQAGKLGQSRLPAWFGPIGRAGC